MTMAAKKAAALVSIYGLHHPDTGELRYVGKANDPAARLKTHMRDSRRRSTPVYSWIRALTARGQVPAMAVLSIVAAADWPAEERRIIALHKDAGRLLNLAEGGDEPHCPQEVRAANGRATAKAVHSDPYRRRVWELKQSAGLYLRECIRSGDKEREERTRARMRQLAVTRPDICADWATV